MAICNNKLGGKDFYTGQQLKSADLNDTFNAVHNLLVGV